jgi:exodeoxyribonuclease-5
MSTTAPVLQLTEHQNGALQRIFDWLIKDGESRSRHLVISGYAGTGKTTLIAYFRRELKHQKDWEEKKVAFCCYTGKAASVLRQKLTEGRAIQSGDNCSTIHSLIYKAVTDEEGLVVRWEREQKLIYDLIIVDEGSMLNEGIWRDLLSYNVPILVFGDHGQLPPIEGRFNLMQTSNFTMEQIVRQAADNPIIQLSIRIRGGGGIPYGTFNGGSIKKYALDDPESEDYFNSAITGAGDDYLCICGRNRTRINLNQRIRELLSFSEVEPNKGERIICLKNNHTAKIYNGMLGRLISIHPHDEHWYQICVVFEESRQPFEGLTLRYQFNQEKTLKEPLPPTIPVREAQFENLFDFGYALTAHKAQGSEAKRVIVFEERMFHASDEDWRRWLYTAITRAKEEIIVFG